MDFNLLKFMILDKFFLKNISHFLVHISHMFIHLIQQIYISRTIFMMRL